MTAPPPDRTAATATATAPSPRPHDDVLGVSKREAPGPLEANAEREEAIERKGAPAPSAGARSPQEALEPPPTEADEPPSDEPPSAVWDRRYAAHPLSRQEAWLTGWQHRLPGVRRALDIGCGDGWETAALLELGVDVTGIDISAETPKVLTVDAVQASDVCITMGCGDTCPVFPGKRYLDWTLPDPAGRGVEAVRPIRDEIKTRIEGLITELGLPEHG